MVFVSNWNARIARCRDENSADDCFRPKEVAKKHNCSSFCLQEFEVGQSDCRSARTVKPIFTFKEIA